MDSSAETAARVVQLRRLICRSYDYWNSSDKEQALSTFPWNLEILVKISNQLTLQSSNSLKSIDQVLLFGSQHPLPQQITRCPVKAMLVSF